MRAVYELLKIALGVAAGAGLVVVLNTNLHIYDGSGAKSVSMWYADLAALNLTVASLVLGAVALIVGLFAVFGFQVIRTESVSNAEKHVLKEMPQMVETELRKMEKNGGLSRAMERVIYSGGPENDDGSETAA